MVDPAWPSLCWYVQMSTGDCPLAITRKSSEFCVTSRPSNQDCWYWPSWLKALAVNWAGHLVDVGGLTGFNTRWLKGRLREWAHAMNLVYTTSSSSHMMMTVGVLYCTSRLYWNDTELSEVQVVEQKWYILVPFGCLVCYICGLDLLILTLTLYLTLVCRC